jgi:serine O-acetyltransferase
MPKGRDEAAAAMEGMPFHGQDVRRVVESVLADERIRHIGAAPLPERSTVATILDRLQNVLFPGFFGRRNIDERALSAYVEELLNDIGGRLCEQVAAALRYQTNVETHQPIRAEQSGECEVRAQRIVVAFISRLPNIRRLLSLDVQAAYDGDPAAQHTDEVIFSYPGLYALSIHRCAHELYELEVPLVPRMMAELAHSVTGIDIHPGAKIGASFFIDHGTGVVIGETARIGEHCKIYQGVTLGAKSFQKDERGRLKRGVKRHPTLEDHVIVYAGATILGGDTVIGAGSVINGGVFVTNSVPPGHIVRGPKTDITLRSNPQLPPTNYNI